MAFEVFRKGTAPVSKVPTVTIQKRGLMSVNRAAHALIGSPDYVEFLWDPAERIIGLRATEPENPNAYPMRPQSQTSDKGPLVVAGTLFTRHYDIPTEESRRWVVRAEGNVLLIELSTEGQPVIGNRKGRSSDGAAADE